MVNEVFEIFFDFSVSDVIENILGVCTLDTEVNYIALLKNGALVFGERNIKLSNRLLDIIHFLIFVI